MYHLNMRTCIVIPTCNRPQTLRRAIESVLRQEIKAHEVVVVDDGMNPPDLSGFPQMVRLVQSGQVGPTKARMVGVVNASLSCDCFGFLDDDDEFLPNHLSTLVPLLGRGQFVFSKAMYKHKDFETTDPEPLNKGKKRYYDPTALMTQNIAAISCFLMRRKAFEDVGGFDSTVARLEDWDLWGRMQIQHGDPIHADVVTNVIYRDTGDNTSDSNLFAYSLMCKWRDRVEQRLRYLAVQKRGMMSPLERESFRPPRVSVVMPVYNAEKYLREAIDSILNQTFKNFEFVVVNDASTDSSKSILESYGRALSVFEHPSRMGVSTSLNLGVMHSLGEYVARMDADDMSHEKRLEVQVRFMDNNRDLFVLGGRFLSMSEDMKSIVWENKVELDHDEIKKTLKERNCMGHPTVMIRRKLFEKIGGYDESPARRHVEDYDLWVRAIPRFKFANLPGNLLMHRVHQGQVTLQNEAENKRNAEAVRELARRTL